MISSRPAARKKSRRREARRRSRRAVGRRHTPKAAATKKKDKKEPAPKKEKPERAPAEPSMEVFVGNLPFTTEAAAVEAHLSTAAKCTVELKMRQRGGESKPSGCAIATFESIKAATKAVNELHDTELDGRTILVRFSHPEASTTAAPKKEKEKAKPERAPAEPSTEVFVGNLPFATDAAAVEAHLSAIAKCSVELKMRQRGKESKPAGFAIATFESIKAATKAVNELHDTELDGRKIIIRFSTTA